MTDKSKILKPQRFRACLTETRNQNIELDHRMAALTAIETHDAALRQRVVALEAEVERLRVMLKEALEGWDEGERVMWAAGMSSHRVYQSRIARIAEILSFLDAKEKP